MKASSQSRPLVRFLRTFALPYLPVYALGIAALLATNYINVLIPKYIQEAIDSLEKGAPAAQVESALLALGGFAAVVIITRTLSRILFFNPGRTIEFRLKNTYFYHVMRLPLRAFQEWTTGDLISRGTNDMNYVRSVIGFATLQILNLSMALTLALVEMARIDWALTLTCAIPLTLGLVLLRYGIRQLLLKFRVAQQQLSGISTSILNAYTGASVIQSLQAESVFDERIETQNSAYVNTYRSMVFLSAFALPLVQVAGSTCLAILLYMGGQKAVEGTLSVGQIAAYASYLGIVVTGLTSSGWMVNALQRGLASLNRVYEVMDLPVALPTREDAFVQREASTPCSLSAQGLSFSYSGNPGDFKLEDIHFEAGPGDTIGLFGPTGSGKSTLLSLLAGLHPQDAGTVELNERELKDWTDAEIRKRVAFVPQNAFLFSRSIRENIGFSDPVAAIEESRLMEGVREAVFEKDLEAFEQGLETIVGERGVTLSGGQRQRVALARAFYQPFGLLLLDDVLSAVDHTTEYQLVENIQRRTQDFTTIVASHRISAFRHAREILVLSEGRVVDRGNHLELIQREGLYKDAWMLGEQEEAP